MPKQNKIIDEIILDLRSKDKERINRGIDRIDRTFSELHEQSRNNKSRVNIPVSELVRKLLLLNSDNDWETRRAAINGLRMICTTIHDKDLKKIASMLLKRITDEDGRVRWATVQTLDWFRIYFPNELYIETYFKLQEIHDQESGGVRKSIRQALERMNSPHFRWMLQAMEYKRIGKYSEEVEKALAMEAMIIGLRDLADEIEESNRSKSIKMKQMPITPETTLKDALARYNKDSLEAMVKALDLPKPITGLKKEALTEKISTNLHNPKVLNKAVTNLKPEENLALLDLLLKHGTMPREKFIEKYGDDIGESIYWKWHPPKSTLGRLKMMGLIIEGSYKEKVWIQVPKELKPLLEEIGKRLRNPEKSK